MDATDDKPKSPDVLILDGQQRLTSLYSVMCDKQVRDKDYRTYRIQIAFNPLSETFAVPDAAITRNPEYIADITELWNSGEGGFAFTTRFLESLQASRELSTQERKKIADSISQLEALEKYPFIGLELAGALEEERAAEVFVRINSEGVTLKQADFILTLMSVFQEKLRVQLEEFSRHAQQPSLVRAVAVQLLHPAVPRSAAAGQRRGGILPWPAQARVPCCGARIWRPGSPRPRSGTGSSASWPLRKSRCWT